VYAFLDAITVFAPNYSVFYAPKLMPSRAAILASDALPFAKEDTFFIASRLGCVAHFRGN